MNKGIRSIIPEVGYSPVICQFNRTGASNNKKNGSVEKLSPTVLSADDILNDFHEPGILTGYRCPQHSMKACILSLFQLHNETVNIWTQLIPAAYFFHEFLRILSTGDPFLIIYLATTVLFLMTSACAHTFSCLSPSARHICFFLDYAGITLYACGCAVCYYAYSLPRELMKPSALVGADVCDVYLFLSIFISIWSTHLSGTTRFWKPTFFRKVIRLSAFVVIWLYLAVPVIWRMFACNENSEAHLGECSSLYYWKLQFASAITAGSLYVSHFPERWFPGKFDIIGHSHQIFHLFGASGAFNQYRALWVDYIERGQTGHNPSLSLCVLCVSVVLFANSIIFLNFYKKVNHIHRHHKK